MQLKDGFTLATEVIILTVIAFTLFSFFFFSLQIYKHLRSVPCVDCSTSQPPCTYMYMFVHVSAVKEEGSQRILGWFN